MLPKTFNILDRQQPIQQNYLLEASAGTGKTFSIEHLVVRLILEAKIPLEKILVVTFTRAATRDLKQRIRANLERALQWIRNDATESSTPDYLLAFCEGEESSRQAAQRALEQALFTFDQAQIFTIHGFCARVLRDHPFEGDLMLQAAQEEEPSLMTLEILRGIRDFIRTELREGAYSPAQINILLSSHQGSIEKLENAIKKILESGYAIQSADDFQQLLNRFQQAMKALKTRLELTHDKILADFERLAFSYEGICDRQRQIKPEPLEKVTRFADLFAFDHWDAAAFDRLLADGLFLVEALSEEHLKTKAKLPLPGELHYPELIPALKESLLPIVEEAGNPLHLLARVASGCQKHVNLMLQEEEKVSFNDLLRKMQQRVQDPQFALQVRQKYQAAIIDEFQDTDPLQWGIFRNLFPPEDSAWGNLFLVGDPKQSIYAFRQADIYTYLSAANALGENQRAVLSTNFRSQPTLVAALNRLFSEETTPQLIGLPRLADHLVYHQVSSSPLVKEKQFSDGLGSVHFCLATVDGRFQLERLEEQAIFPYMAEELKRLHLQENVALQQCAVLVSDRFQARRLIAFLQSQQIPALFQRQETLVDSKALPALRELLQAIWLPRHESFLKIALGGAILRWSDQEIRQLTDRSLLERVIACHTLLRQQWLNQGFALFFENLLKTIWPLATQSLAEQLLAREGGLTFYEDLCQLGTFLMEEEQLKNRHPEAVLALLDQLMVDPAEGEREALQRRSNPSQDAVRVLTLHSSKGLEFGIVFALGLMTRPKAPFQIVPVETEPVTLQAVTDHSDARYCDYCREIDAEKMRQLYVALTRAKYRVYVPVALAPLDKGPEIGSASPMELFLARLNQPGVEADALYQRIRGYDGGPLRALIEKSEGILSCTQLQLIECCLSAKASPARALEASLVPPRDGNVPIVKEFLHSFTTLSRGLKSVPTSAVLAPNDYEALEKTRHMLPSGSALGNLLHSILEKIDFDLVHSMKSAAELQPHLVSYLLGTPFEAWLFAISDLVFHALSTPLAVEAETFCLCAIPLTDCYREIEFLYPCAGLPELEELQATSGFLKGVIDLVFQYKGKYYLVDWKSNWLGPKAEDYTRERLQQAMEEHHYFLQAQVYQAALERYLRVVDKRPFSEIFGGTFYLFLRGLGSGSQGVYYQK